jgi:hypothetical protein
MTHDDDGSWMDAPYLMLAAGIIMIGAMIYLLVVQ